VQRAEVLTCNGRIEFPIEEYLMKAVSGVTINSQIGDRAVISGNERGGQKEQRRFAMRFSARNVLKGKVTSITHGAVNSEIVIELPGGQEIVSVITKASAESLGLVLGKEVCAVVKASSVMLAVDA
jgi:molybdopterin-binding protein